MITPPPIADAEIEGFLVGEFDYKPSMSVKQGVENFVVWYQEYNNKANED
jgi:hypothetical protein